MQFDLDAGNLNIRHRIKQIKQYNITGRIVVEEKNYLLKYRNGNLIEFEVENAKTPEEAEKIISQLKEGKIRFVISEKPEELKYILEEFKYLLYLGLWGPRGRNIFNYGSIGDDSWIKGLYKSFNKPLSIGKKEKIKEVSILYQKGYIFIEPIATGYVSLFIDGEINWARAKVERKKILSKIRNGLEGLF